jgi:cardiolipin synthase
LLRFLPNAITALRIGLTPWIAAAILRHEFANALWLCAAAGVTDGLDGWTARHFGWKSRLGAYLDPVSDKLLLVTVYVTLALAGAAPCWLVGLVLGRDVLILLAVGAALAFTRLRDFPPSFWGKLSTTVQICSAVDFMAARVWPHSLFETLVPLGVALTAACTLWSGLHYAVSGWRRLRSSRPAARV